MNINSVSDLAKSLQLRRDTGDIKLNLARLTNELSSGVDSDLVGRFKGNFGPLAGVERGIERTESFLSVIAEHQLLLETQQQSITNLRSLGDISTALLTVRESGDPVLVDSAGYDASTRFNSAISTLNTQTAGRSVFSGVDIDRAAIADAETIFTAIESEIALAGAATATDVENVVDAWFAAGGGFDTVGYVGGAALSSGPQLSEGEVAAASPTAEDEAFRSFLSGLAMASLLSRNVLPGDVEERADLARIAGLSLVEADGRLIDLQAQLGASEGQVTRARTEVVAESASLELAKSELIGVDPYDTAVELQSAETQLQTLYSITARLSRLSLTGYL